MTDPMQEQKMMNESSRGALSGGNVYVYIRTICLYIHRIVWRFWGWDWRRRTHGWFT